MTGFFHLGDRRIPFINPNVIFVTPFLFFCTWLDKRNCDDRRIPFINPNGIFVTPFLFFAPGWINGSVTIARLKSEKFSLRKALRQENLTSGGEEMRKPMRPSTGAATLCSGLSRSVTARSCCTQQKRRMHRRQKMAAQVAGRFRSGDGTRGNLTHDLSALRNCLPQS